ncbi:MAG: hypothetical protein P1U86_08250 [Verrucomicrobiales bacterium]|nr:hypothetical protein [Verrucomicrobiales bacterium]
MKDEKPIPELEEWKIDLPEDPHFHSAVWREIAMRDATSPANRLRDILDHLLIPRLAIPAASVAILVVFLGASLHGLRNREKAWENLGLVYSSAIDPISHTGAISSSLSDH